MQLSAQSGKVVAGTSLMYSYVTSMQAHTV